MNISHKHKTIWWAPERSGTKIIREILSDYDFLAWDPLHDDEVSLKTRYTSHLNEIPEKYSDYTLICNIRNPYDRVLSIFLWTLYENIAVEKNKHETVRKRFNEWLKKAFVAEKTIVTLDNKYSAKNLQKNYFSKWSLNGRKPDHFIRMEKIAEDLEKLNFIKDSEIWSSSKTIELLQKNNHRTNRNINFNEMYDFQGAKLVYFYFKFVFNLVPYDPFSFTVEELAETEKISFLHEIL